MNRRTFLGGCVVAVPTALAGCSGNDAAVSDIVVGPAEYEVTADAERTIDVEITNQDGKQVGVAIEDPRGSAAASRDIREEGKLTYDAEQSGTFTVSVDTESRTAVRISVE